MQNSKFMEEPKYIKPDLKPGINACFIHPNPWMCMWGVLKTSFWNGYTRDELIRFLEEYKKNLIKEKKDAEAKYIEEALGFFEGKFGEELKL